MANTVAIRTVDPEGVIPMGVARELEATRVDMAPTLTVP